MVYFLAITIRELNFNWSRMQNPNERLSKINFIEWHYDPWFPNLRWEVLNSNSSVIEKVKCKCLNSKNESTLVNFFLCKLCITLYGFTKPCYGEQEQSYMHQHDNNIKSTWDLQTVRISIFAPISVCPNEKQ